MKDLRTYLMIKTGWWWSKKEDKKDDEATAKEDKKSTSPIYDLTNPDHVTELAPGEKYIISPDIKGSELINNTGQTIPEEQLKAIIDVRKDLDWYAPYPDKKPIILEPYDPEKPNRGGWHEYKGPSHVVWQGDNNGDDYLYLYGGLTNHEENHPASKSDKKDDAAYKDFTDRYDSNLPVHAIATGMGIEQPAVSSELAYNLYKGSLPTYGYMHAFTNYPYFGRMPVGVSTFGVQNIESNKTNAKGSKKSDNDSYFLPWTIPSVETRAQEDAQAEIERDKAYKESMRKHKKFIEDVTRSREANNAAIQAMQHSLDSVDKEYKPTFWNNLSFNRSANIDAYNKQKEGLRNIFNKSGVPISWNGKSVTYYPDEADVNRILGFNKNTELSDTDKYNNLQRIRRNAKALGLDAEAAEIALHNNIFSEKAYLRNEYKKLLKSVGMSTAEPKPYKFEDVEDPIARGILQGKLDLDQASLARRGFTMALNSTRKAPAGSPESAVDFVPYATEIASYEQKKHPEHYSNVKDELFNELSKYEEHPEYFDVMKRWRLTPRGNNLYGLENDSLTTWQMRRILDELKQAEKRRRNIENSPYYQRDIGPLA